MFCYIELFDTFFAVISVTKRLFVEKPEFLTSIKDRVLATVYQRKCLKISLWQGIMKDVTRACALPYEELVCQTNEMLFAFKVKTFNLESLVSIVS